MDISGFVSIHCTFHSDYMFFSGVCKLLSWLNRFYISLSHGKLSKVHTETF